MHLVVALLARLSYSKTHFVDELFVAKKYEPGNEINKVLFYNNFLDEIKIMHKLNH
jgi:hypothetical protein